MNKVLLVVALLFCNSFVQAATEVQSIDGRSIFGYIRFDDCTSFDEAKEKISIYADSKNISYYLILTQGGDKKKYMGAVLLENK